MGHQGRALSVLLLGLLSFSLGACQFEKGNLFPGEADPPLNLAAAKASPILGDPNPGPRWAPALAFDASRGTVVLYGGDISGVAQADMWELDGATWHLMCSPCPPGPRNAPVFVYDSNRQRLVLYGGSTSHYEADAVGTAWTFDARFGWKQLNVPGPSTRFGAAYAFDKSRDALVMYGGALPDGRVLNELWELHGDTWAPGAPSVNLTDDPSPGPRSFAMGTYVEETAAFLIYGGTVDGYQTGLDDLWSWNGSTWMQLCAGCTGTSRWKGPLTAVRGGGVLQLGGFDGAAELAGTRLFNGSILKPLLEAPSARDSMGVAFDPIGSRVVIVGGNGDGCGGGDCNETLQLTFQ